MESLDVEGQYFYSLSRFCVHTKTVVGISLIAESDSFCS